MMCVTPLLLGVLASAPQCPQCLRHKRLWLPTWKHRRNSEKWLRRDQHFASIYSQCATCYVAESANARAAMQHACRIQELRNTLSSLSATGAIPGMKQAALFVVGPLALLL